MTAEWLDLLQAHDLPAVPVSGIEDLAQDPHLRASGFLATVDHPTEGTMLQMGAPAVFSATPANVYRHAPNPGEQSLEVLREAGFGVEEIGALLADGVVRRFDGDPPTLDKES